MQQPTLQLKIGDFESLHSVNGLIAIDKAFVQSLPVELRVFLLAYRNGETFEREQLSGGLIACAQYLDEFVAGLFLIESEVSDLAELTLKDDPIFWFKKHYVLKHAKRRSKDGVSQSFEALSKPLQQWLSAEDPELSLATAALELSEQGDDANEAIIQWCIAASTEEAGIEYVKDWVSFTLPQKLDFGHLIDVEAVDHAGVPCQQVVEKKWRDRDGFDLTDERMSRREVMDETHYCVYCHKNDGDFCSTGFPVKRKKPELGFKVNPLDELLAGCPLDEKISEMISLKRDGYSLGSLAMIMVDNPMCPATGHRICNDCMKACIYQRQTPVDIPQIETRVLTDVLHLPWGVEVYDLLTRWNPLRQQQYLPQDYNGKNVMVMGLGPAGFTLSHYLTMAGYAVVGMDGLKIEPVDSEWLNQPIYNFDTIYEPLSERVVHGFGGVAEYGITVRWDKNFLKLIYISLMRRKHFQAFGSVRFGGTVTVEQAWQLGFDHLAIAVGAGLPKELPIENSLAPGMRQANDFLMSLQLTGASKKDSLANLQVRLPAVVIGGGLTGVDTATEVGAYYLVQIEKIAYRYQQLCADCTEDSVRQQFTPQDLVILDEFLHHAKQLAEERKSAARENRKINSIKLIRRFGGVTIVYRRAMTESPAYRKNHEELAKALEEGIFYAEQLSPEKVSLDEVGACKALVCVDADNKSLAIPARSIFVATGAKPNVAYAFEHKDTFVRDRYQYREYQSIGDQLEQVAQAPHSKSDNIGMFTSYTKDDKRVTFLGDTHPVFHGNVVQAIASGLACFKAINAQLSLLPSMHSDYNSFHSAIKQRFTQSVVSNKLIHPNVREIILHAPQAARAYQPGQFFRLQNFEQLAKHVSDTSLEMEGVSCMASVVSNQPDQLALLVFDRGTSTRLSSQLIPNEPISLMGPTGVRSKIPDNETILLIGGALAIAHLRGWAPALQVNGNKLVYIGLFDTEDDIFLREEVERVCHQVHWCCDKAIDTYLHELQQSEPEFFEQVDQVGVIGDSDLLCEIKHTRGTWLDKALSKDVVWSASVYAPMQCMLKGVCAQCLTWQIDPVTGERTKAVYACSWQHQPFEKIDIANIDERLQQNNMQQQLADLWLANISEGSE
ncbi:MAG: FAD-dependent oxidoreductase [Coxiellaceae bacterium]|nr:FAD-dependent oxidoreductase [Coxiellaceae bacterium]